MNGFIDKARSFLTGQRQSARDKLRDLAQRVAAGTSKDADLTALPALLAAAGADQAEFERLTALFSDVAQLKREAADVGKAVAGRRQARARKAQLTADLERLVEEHQQKINEAERASWDATTRVEAAEKARARLEVLEYEHADVLGLAIDLDKFTLRSGDTVISVSDPAAPEREVPPEVFRRETERRRELVNAAWTKLQAQHAEAVKRWTRRAERSYAGRLIGSPPPEPERPTWADLMSGTLASIEAEPEPEEAFT